MTQRIIISGCSGGGKSTLLEALRRRGEIVIEEPGRRIVAEELAGTGAALPWIDGTAFARRAIEMSRLDLDAISLVTRRAFFDRGLIDAAVALSWAAGGPTVRETVGDHRFHPQVFFALPWQEIYRGDDARRHGFADAVAECNRLRVAYAQLGYDVIDLPKSSVGARMAFLLRRLADCRP